MDLKALSLSSEQFPWQRRKLISGLGLAFVASVLVLSVFSFSHYLDGSSFPSSSSLGLLFQGFRNPSNATNVAPTKNFAEEAKNGSSVAEKTSPIGSVEEEGGQNGNFSGSDNGLSEECDIFDGKWIRDESKPFYPGGSCPHIDKDFDCHLNQRPDDDYVKWKWRPNGCEIPK